MPHEVAAHADGRDEEVGRECDDRTDRTAHKAHGTDEDDAGYDLDDGGECTV